MHTYWHSLRFLGVFLGLLTNVLAQEITRLEPGKPITRSSVSQTTPTQTDVFQFSLKAGQFIRIVTKQTEIDTTLSLFAPDGKTLLRSEFNQSFGQDSISYEVPSTGVYQLRILPRTIYTSLSPLNVDPYAMAAGTYQVQLEVKDSTTSQDRQRIAAEALLNEAMLLVIPRPNAPDGALSKGLENYQKVMQIWRDLGDRDWEAITFDLIGKSLLHNKKFEQAIEAYQQSLAIKRELADQPGQISTLHFLGLSYRLWDRSDQSLLFHEQALALSRESKHLPALRLSLNNLAYHYWRQKQVEKVIQCLEEILTVDRQQKHRKNEAETLYRMGRLTSEPGRLEKTLEYYEQALTIWREMKLPHRESRMLEEMGIVNQSLFRFEQAIYSYEQALRIHRTLNIANSVSFSLNNIGNLYFHISHIPKAIGSFEQALEHSRKIKSRLDEIGAMTGLGKCYLAQGHYENAQQYLEQALALSREVKSPYYESRVLASLGYIFYKRGNNVKSIELSEKAIASIKDSTIHCYAFVNLGEAWRSSGQIGKAIEYHLQALELARKILARDIEAFALEGLLLDWKTQNQPLLATFFGKQAVNIYQDLRSNLRSFDQQTQRNFIQSKEPTYRDLADLLIAQGRLPEAEQVIRMLKEEEFFDYIRRDVDNSPKGEKAALTPEEAAIEKRYREIADQLTVIGTQRGELLAKEVRTSEDEKLLAKLEADLTVAGQAFQKFLDGLSKEFAAQRSDRMGQVREAQGLMEDLRELGKGTVALYTLVGEKKFRVILTTADVQKAYEAPIGEAALNRKILALRTALQNPKLDPRPAAQELYQILFAPLAKDLRAMKATTLMWSLDGVLRYVPVSALYDGEKYLVEHFRHVVFTPASNARLKDTVSKSWQALGLGVTRGFGDKIPALPAVVDEMRGIIREGNNTKGVLPGTIKLDEQFTEESMKAGLRQKPTVVHVASHFDFKPGNESDSALLLGDGKFLSLAQIKVMPNVFSGVELLTLSACNTATSGNGANGKEVEGFGVLAQRQGAKAVVASLWPVADRTTQMLMEEFYRGREANKLTKIEAMRQAQLKLLRGELTKQGNSILANREITHEASATTAPPFKADAQRPHAHPYYWAPFILIGNWK